MIQEHEASPQILGKSEFPTQRHACPVSRGQKGPRMMSLTDSGAGPRLRR